MTKANSIILRYNNQTRKNRRLSPGLVKSNPLVKPKPKKIALLPSVAQKFIKYYAQHSSVCAVVTIGSLVSKKNDMRSDIDIVIICESNKIPPLNERLGVIEKISVSSAKMKTTDLRTFTFGTSEDFIIDNQEICTQFFTKEYMLETVDRIVNGTYQHFGMEHPLAFLNSIITAKIHIDKEDFYIVLREKIEPFPKKLQETILSQEKGLRFPYYLKCLETAIARQDIPYANKMINNAIDSALYILFANNMRYPHGPKRLYQQLESFLDNKSAAELKSCLDKLFYTNNMPSSLPRKLGILEDLFSLVDGVSKARGS